MHSEGRHLVLGRYSCRIASGIVSLLASVAYYSILMILSAVYFPNAWRIKIEPHLLWIPYQFFVLVGIIAVGYAIVIVYPPTKQRLCPLKH